MSHREPMTRLVIMGAAGRAFHNFNLVYREAFVEAQRPELVQPAVSERQRLGTDGRRAAAGRGR